MLMGDWGVAGALWRVLMHAERAAATGQGAHNARGFRFSDGKRCVVIAEQWVPSGLAAVLVATNPFWMAAVEAALPDGERLRANTMAGQVIGFSGIVVLVWPDLTLGAAGRQGFLAGVIALQIATLGWSLGSAYSRRHARKENVLGTSAFQMLAGGLIMTAAGTFLGEWPRLYFTTRTAIALVYLSTIGAVEASSPTRTRCGNCRYRSFPVRLINPVIAVALGVLVSTNL